MPIKFSAFNLLTSAGLVCNDLNCNVFVFLHDCIRILLRELTAKMGSCLEYFRGGAGPFQGPLLYSDCYDDPGQSYKARASN